MAKYRKIKKTNNSNKQAHELTLMCTALSILITIIFKVIYVILNKQKLIYIDVSFLDLPILTTLFISFILFIFFIFFYSSREKISTLEIPEMNRNAYKLSKKIRRLFTNKQVIDVLKLSNTTRYGEELPNIYVYVESDCNSGYVAIENICNFDKMDRDKYEQRISGIFSGNLKRFAVVSSNLSASDVYMIFNFEDMLNSNRIYIKDNDIHKFISSNKHDIILSSDLIWHSDMTPHISIIARTRSGKSILCGRYMAKLMLLQGWTVEYNSSKYDLYVKKYNGVSDSTQIVERVEYWVNVMEERLTIINQFEEEKYTDIKDMEDIGLFFDEIGNLNAELDQDKKLKARWENAINKLSATGGSAGIHLIAISQFATKEGFLPSLARVNCSDAVIMLGGAADSADERKYLMPGYADMPKRNYGKGQGVAKIISSSKKWQDPHFYESPWFID